MPHSWVLRAPQVVAGKKVIDGAAPFQPKTLLIEARSTTPPSAPADVPGNIVLQFTGLCQDGSAYYRRFAIGAWSAVSLYIEPFSGLQVEVLGNNLSGFDLVVSATDGEEASSQPFLLYPETVGAGTWLVPWGASEMIPLVDDPAFAWVIADANGNTYSVAMPAVAGQTQQVTGLRYTTSATTGFFAATWRIRP